MCISCHSSHSSLNSSVTLHALLLLPKFQHHQTQNYCFFFVLFCFCSTSLVRSSEGTIFTPNWPLKYPPDISCLWPLNLHRSKATRFFFSALDLELNFICKTDEGRLATDDISISGEWWQKFTVVSYISFTFFSPRNFPRSTDVACLLASLINFA